MYIIQRFGIKLATILLPNLRVVPSDSNNKKGSIVTVYSSPDKPPPRGKETQGTAYKTRKNLRSHYFTSAEKTEGGRVN